MSNPNSEPKQATQATSPHDGWLTRAQVAAELGYRSIFPIRKMEGTKLHPVREARGWVFDPGEVAALKAKRPIATTAAGPLPDGRIAARVFYLFDHGRELREIVQEIEVPPSLVRDLWHEWLTDLQDGEITRRKTAQRGAAQARGRGAAARARPPQRAGPEELRDDDGGVQRGGLRGIGRQVGGRPRSALPITPLPRLGSP